MPSIPINSGTGPRVAVDTVGTNNFQIVKIMQATDGATASLGTSLTISGSVSVIAAPAISGTVSIVGTPAVTAANVTIASIATGTVSIVGTPVITATVSVLPAISGTVSIIGTPAITAANVTVASVTTGTMHVVNTVTITGTVDGLSATVGTISTVLGVVAVSGGGGGAQYSAGATDMGATGTGTLFLGLQTGATTGRAVVVTTSGQQLVQVSTGTVSIVGTPAVTAANITVASITTGSMTVLGTVAISGTATIIPSGTQSVNVVAGNQQYAAGTTGMGSTATGNVLLGIQTGATTGRAIALTTSGQALVQVSTGTISVINVLSASGVTLASLATGTVNVVNTVAISGSASVINTVAISGTVTGLLVTTTASHAVVATAHSSRWDGFVVNTTSGASAIIKTSGAHTLYVTDMIVSVDVPTRIDILSAATTKMSLYLATKGGMAVALTSPMVLNSAQSLTFQPSVSGSSMVWAAGYTVT